MKWTLICGLLLATISLHAQEKKYFIFLFSGDVWVKSPGHAAVKAKPKQVLMPKDEFELKNDASELAIANTAGYYFVIRNKGMHSMDEILKMEKSRTPGITPKFLSYLYEEMLHPKKTGRFSQETVAASWGAGSRGIECLKLKTPGDGLVSSKDTLVFKWAHNSKTLAYNFILYDHDGSELFNCIVRDTQFIVSTTPFRNMDNEKFSWTVKAIAKPCSNVIKKQFELVTATEEKKRIDILLKDVPQKNNEILYNLAVADVLGLNGFYDKAIEYFSKAWLAIER